MIYRWFGVAAFLFPPFLFLLGFKWTFKFSVISLTRYSVFALFFTAWLGLLTGYAVILVEGYSYWSFAGAFLIFVVLFFGIQQLNWFSPKEKSDEELSLEDTKKGIAPNPFAPQDHEEEVDPEEKSKPAPITNSPELSFTFPEDEVEEEDIFDVPQVNLLEEGNTSKPVREGNFTVQKAPELEKTAEEVENLDPYDPTLDLPRYKYPTLDLLNDYDVKKVTVTRQELEENKDKIVTTLKNFQIGIQGIQATIGPTVTLYEIVPDPGVKISKIKNLEDDIA
nr:DNA translocase FtsK [Algoriphagus sp.]